MNDLNSSRAGSSLSAGAWSTVVAIRFKYSLWMRRSAGSHAPGLGTVSKIVLLVGGFKLTYHGDDEAECWLLLCVGQAYWQLDERFEVQRIKRRIE